MTEVPGYELLQRLGERVWRARQRSGGAEVAVRLVPDDGSRRQAEEVRQVSAVAPAVRALPSPHVVRLRAVVRLSGAGWALVHDLAAGGSLAALLARRGRLSPGEVVTALAPVAEALGQAHATGLVHGRVTARAVLLDAAGRPLLDGLGTAELLIDGDGPGVGGSGGGPAGAADVRALGVLAHELLTGSPPAGEPVLPADVPPGLAQVVLAALHPDPGVRPSAAATARLLLAACPAEPLHGIRRLPAAPPRAEPVRPRRPRWALVLAVLLAVLGTAAGLRGRGPAPREEDWRAVVAGLDAIRAEAFAAGSPALLDRVWLPGSRGLADDRRLLASLVRTGRRADGVRHDVTAVRARARSPGEVRLQVEEALAAHLVRDARGAVVARYPAGPVEVHVLVLRRGQGGWRLAEVRGQASAACSPAASVGCAKE